ncbi:WD40/YVTN/BNR-like repeat-containing protein [Pseudomonas putida]|uniref:BNR domain-containing protein n=1 Tax=Pseudomonas putida TaxID=303 RepID=A0A177SSX1_PSEPU|nr:YCF48-related protein [Pseudomonas putida]OAI94082.1 BNR domain-containing protein [Pseudomonas putida]
MNRLLQSSGLLLVLALPLASTCQAQAMLQQRAVGDVLQSPAMQIAHPQRAVFTALARAGERLVAVGERGLILLSDDNGQHWRQVAVPVSVGLTAVAFADARNGWVTGHSGVVLATRDGGERWSLQLDGERAAQVELEDARRAAQQAPQDETAVTRLETAERIAGEAADKPFLAVAARDERSVLVVGAYGLALRSDDGGASWHSLMGRIDNPDGLHLYAVARQGESWVLAGEQGYLARSDDGEHFHPLPSPYHGSLFTLATRADGALLIGGLKGNAFVLAAGAQQAEALPTLAPVSFSDAITLGDGRVLLSNQSGGLFTSAAGGLEPAFTPQRKPVAAVVQAADGSLVTAGFTGLSRVAAPTVSASE